MTNRSDPALWLREARAALGTAERAVANTEWRVACQYGQLAIELAAKAASACFAEPHWTHAPGSELLRLVAQHEVVIRKTAGDEAPGRLRQLGTAVDMVAEWHGRSTYGQQVEGRWISAEELCTEQAARDLTERAGRAVGDAAAFVEMWVAVTPESADGELNEP